MKNTRGSEWNKWDLHVHNPFTKFNNGFSNFTKNGNDCKGLGDGDRLKIFSDIIEKSDVKVVGITDYFDYVDSLRTIEHFRSQYPKSDKKFLINIEFRLEHSVNKDGQNINIHLILDEDVNVDRLQEFMYSQKITYSDGHTGKLNKVRELSKTEAKTVMVNDSDLIKTLKIVFGEDYQKSVIVVASGRNDGISPGKNNKNPDRNWTLIDRVDKCCDAIFSRSADAQHWIRTDRYEPSSRPLPTFGGCDAHSLDSLKEMLGSTGSNSERNWETTWIKAETSFTGLLQTLIEPDERVKIQEFEPDSKENFYVIKEIQFNSPDKFSPEPIKFNKNLNTIIGSRSSGKSALLSYISYSVDPDKTKKRLESSGNKEADKGPAAGISWEKAKTNGYIPDVRWMNPNQSSGQVLYVPQNSLFSISDRPEEITTNLIKLIELNDKELHGEFNSSMTQIEQLKKEINDFVSSWFTNSSQIEDLKRYKGKPSDLSALKSELKRTDGLILEAKASSQLSDEEISSLSDSKNRLEECISEKNKLRNQLNKLKLIIGEKLSIILLFEVINKNGVKLPHEDYLPENYLNWVNNQLKYLSNEFNKTLVEKTSNDLIKTESEINIIEAKIQSIKKEIQPLEIKNKSASHLQALEETKKTIEENISFILKTDKNISDLNQQNEKIISRITGHRKTISELQDVLVESFKNSDPIDDINISIEFQLEPGATNSVKEYFNLRHSNKYIDKEADKVRFDLIFNKLGEFLTNCFTNNSEDIKLKSSFEDQDMRLQFAQKCISSVGFKRLSARFLDDTIGGYLPSTMTPGKQSLFALTLLLASSNEKWPLLIDQPEDDLDSRSIFDTVVPYLKKRKRERQIIMVTHNANMAIGADSEEIIVVNRHNENTPNPGNVLFNYKTGALENSFTNEEAAYHLDKNGISETCCLYLDGGKEAFKNRKLKYSI